MGVVQSYTQTYRSICCSGVPATKYSQRLAMPPTLNAFSDPAPTVIFSRSFASPKRSTRD
jgi:hypothetical protein